METSRTRKAARVSADYRGGVPGTMYHCKGFTPWAGDSGLAFHMSIYDFLIYDYYLTGNRRSISR